jgi:hypothetical protein
VWRAGVDFLVHDHPNRVDAAFLIPIRRTPRRRRQKLLGGQSDAAEQQIRNSQDQQQAIQPIGLGDLSVTQAPAIAFALVVAE